MSTSLNIMAVESAMKTIFEADSDVSNAVEYVIVEPSEHEFEIKQNSIFIVRQDAPLQIITTGNRYQVNPIISIFCSVLNYNRSMFDTKNELDSMIEKVLRVIIDNKRWGQSQVLTSKPISIQFRDVEGFDEEEFIAMSKIDIELTMYLV